MRYDLIYKKTDEEKQLARTPIEYVPDIIKERFNRIPDSIKELTEEEIIKKLKPNSTQYRIRERFWAEFSKCIKEDRPRMNFEKVYSHYASTTEFFRRLIRSDLFVAFMFTPIQKYDDQVSSLLNVALGRLDEILNMDISSKRVNKDGEVVETVNPKLAEVLLKAIKHVEERVKGKAVERTVNINMANSPDSKLDEKDLMDIKKIDERINEIESKLGVIPNESNGVHRESIIEVAEYNSSENRGAGDYATEDTVERALP